MDTNGHISIVGRPSTRRQRDKAAGRKGEREKRRKGEREKGKRKKRRKGERKKGRKGEREKCMRMFLKMYHADGNGVYDDRRFAEGELSKVVAF